MKALLLSLGFHFTWVPWIMACVSTVKYSVLINGESHGFISLERGLRQRDPISLLLLVFCAEGLSHHMVNQASDNGLFNGIQFFNEGPSIHHLYFVGNSLFLCKTDLSQCHIFQDIFNKYEEATWQIINLAK